MAMLLSDNVLKSTLLFGVGYVAYYGQPLVNRRIQSEETESYRIDVDDTRGEPVIDEEWPYKIRDKSLKCLEATFKPVKYSKSTPIDVKSITNDKEFDVLILGGAAAGLSSAAWCEKLGLTYLVFEKNENVSDIWMSRYHRLHLHDIVERCNLPFFDMPDTYPVFPSRKEFAQYLESYKSILELKVATSHLVRNVKRISKTDKNSGWILSVENMSNNNIQQYQCKHLIMANGVFGDPNLLPNDINTSDNFKGLIVHSSKYTNGTDLNLKNKKVLVVGWGNSGAEIALDLLEHGAQPTLLIRGGQVVIPHTMVRELEAFPHTHLIPMVTYIPFSWLLLVPYFLTFDILTKIRCRLYYGNLMKYGLVIHKKGLLARFIQDGIAPLMDVGTIAAIKDGNIKVINSEIKEFNENGNDIQFKNNQSETFDAVVLATGYQIFNAHKHWLDKDDQKIIGEGVKALRDNKIRPGSNFKQLPTLWYCFGNLIMIKEASEKCVTEICDAIRKNKKFKRQKRIWWIKQIVKHLVVLMFMIKLWHWWKANRK